WWKDQEAKERAAAATEYDELPAARVWRFLIGDAPDERVTLDRAATEAVLGRGNTRGPTHAIPLRTRDGILPDDLADTYGFATGEEMLRAMVALPRRDEYARELAAQRM